MRSIYGVDSSLDQHKLDEYLESVREVEARIANAGKRGEFQGWRPTLFKAKYRTPRRWSSPDIGEHMR